MEEDSLHHYNLPKEVSGEHVVIQTLVRFNCCIVQV